MSALTCWFGVYWTGANRSDSRWSFFSQGDPTQCVPSHSISLIGTNELSIVGLSSTQAIIASYCLASYMTL